MTPLLRLDRVGKTYGTLRAVDGVSLEVRTGEIVALVGPNGAGKSTLLKTVAGLVRPTTGTVEVGGRPVHRDPVAARRLVGFVPQRVAFHDALPVRRVLAFYAALKHHSGVDLPGTLAAVGLADAADRDARTLSGGMMQRLGLAIALLGRPPLLVLDEPTVSLDPDGSTFVRQVLAEQRTRGGSVVIATHLLTDAELLADRVCLMAGGSLLADDSVPNLVRRFVPALAPRLEGWQPEVGLLESVYREATRVGEGGRS